MNFGEIPVDNAAGATLAHGLSVGGRKFKKGRVLSADDIAALRKASIAHVVAVQMDRDDVREDAAAQQIADAATGDHLTATAAFTGRVNLYADARGLAVYDRNLLNEINRIDEAITIAALPPFAPIEPRRMVATIKIIPFAVYEQALALCVAKIETAGGLFRVAPYQARSVGLIQTTLPGTLNKVLDKTVEVVRARIEALGGTLIGETRCAHDAADLAPAISTLR